MKRFQRISKNTERRTNVLPSDAEFESPENRELLAQAPVPIRAAPIQRPLAQAQAPVPVQEIQQPLAQVPIHRQPVNRRLDMNVPVIVNNEQPIERVLFPEDEDVHVEDQRQIEPIAEQPQEINEQHPFPDPAIDFERVNPDDQLEYFESNIFDDIIPIEMIIPRQIKNVPIDKLDFYVHRFLRHHYSPINMAGLLIIHRKYDIYSIMVRSLYFIYNHFFYNYAKKILHKSKTESNIYAEYMALEKASKVVTHYIVENSKYIYDSIVLFGPEYNIPPSKIIINFIHDILSECIINSSKFLSNVLNWTEWKRAVKSSYMQYLIEDDFPDSFRHIATTMISELSYNISFTLMNHDEVEFNQILSDTLYVGLKNILENIMDGMFSCEYNYFGLKDNDYVVPRYYYIISNNDFNEEDLNINDFITYDPNNMYDDVIKLANRVFPLRLESIYYYEENGYIGLYDDMVDRIKDEYYQQFEDRADVDLNQEDTRKFVISKSIKKASYLSLYKISNDFIKCNHDTNSIILLNHIIHDILINCILNNSYDIGYIIGEENWKDIISESVQIFYDENIIVDINEFNKIFFKIFPDIVKNVMVDHGVDQNRFVIIQAILEIIIESLKPITKHSQSDFNIYNIDYSESNYIRIFLGVVAIIPHIPSYLSIPENIKNLNQICTAIPEQDVSVIIDEEIQRNMLPERLFSVIGSGGLFKPLKIEHINHDIIPEYVDRFIKYYFSTNDVKDFLTINIYVIDLYQFMLKNIYLIYKNIFYEHFINIDTESAIEKAENCAYEKASHIAISHIYNNIQFYYDDSDPDMMIEDLRFEFMFGNLPTFIFDTSILNRRFFQSNLLIYVLKLTYELIIDEVRNPDIIMLENMMKNIFPDEFAYQMDIQPDIIISENLIEIDEDTRMNNIKRSIESVITKIFYDIKLDNDNILYPIRNNDYDKEYYNILLGQLLLEPNESPIRILDEEDMIAPHPYIENLDQRIPIIPVQRIPIIPAHVVEDPEIIRLRENAVRCINKTIITSDEFKDLNPNILQDEYIHMSNNSCFLISELNILLKTNNYNNMFNEKQIWERIDDVDKIINHPLVDHEVRTHLLQLKETISHMDTFVEENIEFISKLGHYGYKMLTDYTNETDPDETKHFIHAQRVLAKIANYRGQLSSINKLKFDNLGYETSQKLSYLYSGRDECVHGLGFVVINIYFSILSHLFINDQELYNHMINNKNNFNYKTLSLQISDEKYMIITFKEILILETNNIYWNSINKKSVRYIIDNTIDLFAQLIKDNLAL